ncbi:MAG: hypothetical protein HUJ68_11285, partial [Clostridia bacterium]|nr:hypothetical protein [Clostridia bacterium]
MGILLAAFGIGLLGNFINAFSSSIDEENQANAYKEEANRKEKEKEDELALLDLQFNEEKKE